MTLLMLTISGSTASDDEMRASHGMNIIVGINRNDTVQVVLAQRLNSDAMSMCTTE